VIKEGFKTWIENDLQRGEARSDIFMLERREGKSDMKELQK
jgi:hypothetical protein